METYKQILVSELHAKPTAAIVHRSELYSELLPNRPVLIVSLHWNLTFWSLHVSMLYGNYHGLVFDLRLDWSFGKYIDTFRYEITINTEKKLTSLITELPHNRYTGIMKCAVFCYYATRQCLTASYLRQGGYAFIGVSLFVCLLVCL